MKKFDPITLEIYRALYTSVAEEKLDVMSGGHRALWLREMAEAIAKIRPQLCYDWKEWAYLQKKLETIIIPKLEFRDASESGTMFSSTTTGLKYRT